MIVAKSALASPSPRGDEQFSDPSAESTCGAAGARQGATTAPTPKRRSGSEERLIDMGVYVHFPWCLKKCPYCDFVSYATARERIDHEGYADAVVAELRRRAPSVGRGWGVGTVFYGGGPPSLRAIGSPGPVLCEVKRHLPAARDFEVTAE